MTMTRWRKYATLLVLVLTIGLPVAARPAAAEEPTPPTWPVSWELTRSSDVEELSREFDKDEDGYIDASADATRLHQILNPSQATLHVKACAAPPGFTSIDWAFARPGEAPLPAVSTTGCETDLVLPDLPYPEAREYTLTVTVHYPETPDQTRTVPVRVQDVFMVGLGDSYGSGEGNPTAPWKFFGPDARWDNDRCHRSRLSGQEQAARDLDRLPGVNVTFLHLACSGALASTGILQPYEGLIAREPKLPTQIEQAAEYVARSHPTGGNRRYPDVVVTSIGGNDAGFADVVVGCLTYPDWILVPIPVFPYAIPWELDECYEPGEVGPEIFDKKVGDLPALYDEIDAAVDGEHPSLPALCHPERGCEFLITEYPDASTNEEGDPCESHPPGFSEEEFEWVIDHMVPTLNTTIATAAAENGWVYVSGVRDNFYKHGICAEDDWMRDIAESFEIQGDKNGAFHPNTAGHAFGYAPAIVKAARTALGFPYQDLGYKGPLYAGTGQPAECDTTVAQGEMVDAPPTDPSVLPIDPDVAWRLKNGHLPEAMVGANTCANLEQVLDPGTGAPLEMRAGRPGCPDDPRPCHGTSAASSLVRLPKWGDPAPIIDVRAEADNERDAGDPAEPLRRRQSDAIADGTTAFLAVPANGASVVTGEMVVDLTGRAQATGAKADAKAFFRLKAETVVAGGPCDPEAGECQGSVYEQMATVRMELNRYTCVEDSEMLHNCRSTYGHDHTRVDHTVLKAYGADAQQPLVNIDDWHESHDSTAIVAGGGSVRSGLNVPIRQLRIPYSVPAGAVVLIETTADTYSTNASECTAPANNFRCAAQSRSAGRISFVPDAATGMLASLTGFQAPLTEGDKLPPVVTASLTGPAGSNGWYTGDVTVGLAATDEGGSNVDTLSYAVDGGAVTVVDGLTANVPVGGDGTHAVSYWAADGAGNESEPATSTVKIDGTKPTITLAAPVVDGAEVALNAVVPTGLECADATSGVASCAGPAQLDTATPGQRTATFTAADRAGNTAQRTVTYTVVASPAQLAAGLESAVKSFGLQKGRETELLTQIQAASRAIGRGDGRAACTHLTNFAGKVDHAASKRWLTAAQATELRNGLGDLRAALGC